MNRRTMLTIAASFAALPAYAGGHGRLGKFKGVNNHIATGTVEIAGGKVHLLADFTFDGAPDPKIAFGRNGYDASTLMGKLVSNNGKSSYTIPAGIDHSDYNEVWIWCEKFNVALGVAKLA